MGCGFIERAGASDVVVRCSAILGRPLSRARSRPGARPQHRTPHRRDALMTDARTAPDAPLLVRAARDPTGRRRSGTAAGSCRTGTAADDHLDRHPVPTPDDRLDPGTAIPTAAADAGRRRTSCIRARAERRSVSSRLQVAFQAGLDLTAGLAASRPNDHHRIRNQMSGSHSSRAYGTGRSSTNTSAGSRAGPTSSNRVRSLSASFGRNRAR